MPRLLELLRVASSSLLKLLGLFRSVRFEAEVKFVID